MQKPYPSGLKTLRISLFICFLSIASLNVKAQSLCSFTLTSSDTSICAGETVTLTADLPDSTVLTTMAAGNNHRGNMFDIVALNTVTITGFDAHPQANTDFEIYYRVGSFQGFNTTSNGWILVGSAQNVQAQPPGTPTPIPIPMNVTIPAGSTYGFYVTSTNLGVSLNYTNGTSPGGVFASDGNIQFLEGMGGEYPFNITFNPRVWNGVIHYEIPLNFSWSTSATTQVISPSPTTTTTYTVTVTDPGNTCSLSDSFSVMVNPLPVVNLGMDTGICIGDTLQLSAGNPGATYDWSTGVSNQMIQVTNPGYYSVEVTDGFGCVNNDTIFMQVNPLPVVDIGNDTILCSGSTLTLDAGEDIIGSTYLWDNNSTMQTLDVNSGGTYDVVVTSPAGCLGRDTIVVTDVPLPVVDLGSDTSVCSGDSILLDASAGFQNYSWSSGGNGIFEWASAGGFYSVTVTDGNQCEGADTVFVEEIFPPVASFSWTANGLAVDFTNTTIGGVSYFWNFGDGAVDLTSDPSHTFANNGSYSVTLVADNGCFTDTAVIQITVDNGIGVEEWSFDDHLKVYPNPSPGIWTVELSGMSGEQVDIHLYEITGRKIYSQTLGRIHGTSAQIINPGELSNGVYLMELSTDRERVTRRIVIDHRAR